MPNKGGVVNICHFLALSVNGSRYGQKLLFMSNRKLRMRFSLTPMTPRSITLDDLELSSNFQRISQIFGGSNS